MRILDLALKDLSQIFRDKRSLLFLVAMPIAFTFFMGFAYQSGKENEANIDTRIPLGWVNNDPDGAVSQQLFAVPGRHDQRPSHFALANGLIHSIGHELDNFYRI